MSIIYLRVKIKSLAAEASIIRHEERAFPKGQRNNLLYSGLISHRTWDVRNEARASLLAYGFLRHRPYSQIEQPKRKSVDKARVRDLVAKYGGMAKQDAEGRLAVWLEAA